MKWIERWYIEEVGVDPKPLCSCPWIQCRLIMEASCNDNYPLGINSSCIYDWVPCDHGSGHDVLPWFHFVNNMEHWSSTSQRSSSDSIMFHLRELPPWYLEDIIPLNYILWILMNQYLFPVVTTPWVLGCCQPRTLDTFSTLFLWLMLSLFDGIL